MLLKFFYKSFCKVGIKKTFLVLNSNEKGTVEMSDVRLILTLLVVSMVVKIIQLKHDFHCRSERMFICLCI